MFVDTVGGEGAAPPGTLGNRIAPMWNAWPGGESAAPKPNTMYFKKGPWEMLTPAFNILVSFQTSY